MIRLTFTQGSNLRKVTIAKGIIDFLDYGIGQPISFNLLVLAKERNSATMERMKLSKEDQRMVKRLAGMSDEEAADDIKRDFQKQGWRLFKRETE